MEVEEWKLESIEGDHHNLLSHLKYCQLFFPVGENKMGKAD